MMSADLFAAFGNPSEPSQPSSASSARNANLPSVQNEKPNTLDTPLDPSLSFQQGKATNSSYETDPVKGPKPLSSAYRFQDSTTGGNEVLFDAASENIENTDNDDEWGEFESAEPEKPDSAGGLLIDLPENVPRSAVVSPSDDRQDYGKVELQQRCTQGAQPTFDLLSQNDETHNTVHGRNMAPDNGYSGKGTMEPVQDTPELFSSLASRNHEEEEEEWGEFTDSIEPVGSNSWEKQRSTMYGGAHTSYRPRLATKPTSTPSANAQVRPTNIPPPVILLSLFPPLLERLQHNCSKNTSAPGKEQGRAQSGSFHEMTSVPKAMIRVLIGRSLRWKRDSILSQSTKIGPSRAGKPGGMKLSSVNKSESMKEDKEAVEVQEAWKKRAGIFNSVIAARDGLTIPSMVANLQVRTADVQEGALKSSHACALCGLKRDERISKVDNDVNDSFGEWWTDHWGHFECQRFWEQHSDLLDRR